MKKLEIIGYKRANLGKSESKLLRAEGNVPCVIYGGENQIHFYAPAIQFKELVYSPNVYFVKLNIEGEEIQCILQDIQFHPVSEIILHADFLQLFEGKSVKMNIPVNLIGDSPGVLNGGVLVHKRRTIHVEALPKNMPDEIDVDISELDFHKSIKIEEVLEKDFTILDPGQASIAVVEIPRALKIEDELAEELEELEGEGLEGEEGEERAEGETPEEGSSSTTSEDNKEDTKK